MTEIKAQLEAEQKALNDQFTALEQRRQALSKALNEVQTEQVRLQGAYRLVTKLLEGTDNK